MAHLSWNALPQKVRQEFIIIARQELGIGLRALLRHLRERNITDPQRVIDMETEELQAIINRRLAAN